VEKTPEMRYSAKTDIRGWFYESAHRWSSGRRKGLEKSDACGDTDFFRSIILRFNR
jgi:hypothetical protein